MTAIKEHIKRQVSHFIDMWQKPYTALRSKTTRWMLVLGIFCFVWFMMFSFGLYGQDAFPTVERFYVSGIYAFAQLSAMLVNCFVIQDFVLKKYTIGNTFLWTLWFLFGIAFSNFAVTSLWFGTTDFSLNRFIQEQIYVLSIGFVITPMAILIHDRYFLEKKISAIEITYLNVADDDDVLILFKSEEKGREKDFRVMLNRVLYVQSGGNYVDVYYKGDNRIEHKLIRTKLINLEKDPLHPDLVRCHKSYMVNKRNISSIKSSSIRLNDQISVLPLSDTYKKNFK